ncbi:MAG TPA: thioredoxin-disulfide reductase, partial [Lachnospiraceae bacterium]|nr:thioredoxin-disulfide reductase [Lachnospiraceae bacterium]
MYDIGIIGGGTAGMTAAIYGLRAGKSVVIIEGESFGGQIVFSFFF